MTTAFATPPERVVSPDDDHRFMRLAYVEARKAAAKGEVPVGAVVVCDGEVIARGHNRRERGADPTGHAEIVALRRAGRHLGSWRLIGATLYATLEPCAMCIGAAVNARVARVVYGPRDPKAGAVDSLFDIARDRRLNHRIAVTSGVMEAELSEMLSGFFAGLRKASLPSNGGG
jgi:tRNA(adenine34) deaminase